MAGRQIVDAPLAHYTALYEKSDALEISARTGLEYDAAEGRFAVALVGKQYYVYHPRFRVIEISGAERDTGQAAVGSTYEGILILRYLLEGKYVPASGKMLSYEELPWGAVYTTQFKGRVIGRLARMYGKDPAGFKAAAEKAAGLSPKPSGGADAAYRFEFLNGLFISVLIWEGDEEFPPSAQMLFSDNIKYALNAEDIAVAGDILISRLST